MKKPRNEAPAQNMLPSELERRQIFYWLKRNSSVTAWRRVLAYYEAWVNVVLKSAQLADEKGWGNETSLPQLEYARLQKYLAHFKTCVDRLAKGDRRVFRFSESGEFFFAGQVLSHWMQMLERIRIGENGINNHTPLWPEFCDGVNSAAQAWGECGISLLEERFGNDSARLPYGNWLKGELETVPFPAQLAPVPEPSDSIFVWSGLYVPCSGIWEPVAGPKPSLLDVLFRKPKLQPPFQVVGAMNYLHEGSGAPKIYVETAEEGIDVETTWRLLWRDDRYLDGIVPEEEAGYRFSAPNAALPPPPIGFSVWDMTVAESDTRAPTTGRWLTKPDIRVSVYLNKGERLPLYEGRSVQWLLDEINT
ncbi:Imm71 family immunity protein [Pseudoduganella flava]|nr:Imm71 family immunity protein [Pseudoduganella flava]